MGRNKQINTYIVPRSDARKKAENINARVPEPTHRQIEKFEESTALPSKSAAIRTLIEIGLQSYIRNDPRANGNTPDDEEGYSPLTLRDVLPSDREDALNLRDNEVLELLDERIPQEVQNDPKIQQDGWNVWTTK